MQTRPSSLHQKYNDLEKKFDKLYRQFCCLTVEPGKIITATVDTYDDLALLTPIEGQLYYVKYEQGTYWLPGGWGGTYYPSGIYFWDGVDWLNDNISIALELDDLNVDLDALEVTVNNHVTDFSNPHMTPTGSNITSVMTDSSATLYYVGYLRDTDWEITKYVEDDIDNSTLATVSNNPTYLTLSAAWTDRTILTYT